MGTAEGGKHNPKYYLLNSVEEAIHHLSQQNYDLLLQKNQAFPNQTHTTSTFFELHEAKI